jgi:hypothetical protein
MIEEALIGLVQRCLPGVQDFAASAPSLQPWTSGILDPSGFPVCVAGHNAL